MDFPGLEGILGSRASLMLDVVFLAMFIVLPLMAWSIYQVRFRQRYLLHKRLQLLLGLVLLATVALFEIDMRLHDWRPRAEPSAYYPTVVITSLWVHLFFAVPTAVLWIFVIVRALRHFPNPPASGVHSHSHRVWGWIAAVEMTLTAVTGWIFYWLAFVA